MKTNRRKWTAICAVLIFVISLIPIIYLSGYVHATGDDYGYGTWTHAAWLDTHSLIEVFKASFRTIEQYYSGWQGTWFSIFLFSLQPEVFSPDAYWIVPPLMLGLTILGTSLVVYSLWVKKAGFDVWSFVIADCILLFCLIQFLPSTKSGIFWYNGAAHYVVPYFLAMLSVYAGIQYIDTYKRRFLLLAFIGMALLGGASYLAALLAAMLFVLLIVLYGHKRKKVLWLLVPVAAEMVGLVISLLAPGNKVRGGEELGVSITKVIMVIGESFYQGIVTIGIYLKEKTLMFLLLGVLAGITWWAMAWKEKYGNNERKMSYRYPFLVISGGFCVYCAMFAPGIYAGTELSGGVPNTIYQVFVLTAALSIVYCIGWLRTWFVKRKSDANRATFKKIGWGILCVLACGMLMILYLARSTVRKTTFFICVDYIVSGQAADYADQMEERLGILVDDSIRDAELPAMNQDQGPLMHMEVTKDKSGWTNGVVRDFYRKDSVIEVDRTN